MGHELPIDIIYPYIVSHRAECDAVTMAVDDYIIRRSSHRNNTSTRQPGYPIRCQPVARHIKIDFCRIAATQFIIYESIIIGIVDCAQTFFGNGP